MFDLSNLPPLPLSQLSGPDKGSQRHPNSLQSDSVRSLHISPPTTAARVRCRNQPSSRQLQEKNRTEHMDKIRPPLPPRSSLPLDISPPTDLPRRRKRSRPSDEPSTDRATSLPSSTLVESDSGPSQVPQKKKKKQVRPYNTKQAKLAYLDRCIATAAGRTQSSHIRPDLTTSSPFDIPSYPIPSSQKWPTKATSL
ncbi:hypothetical protein JCM16303_000485 [Sporobolomyces ruberrimus]